MCGCEHGLPPPPLGADATDAVIAGLFGNEPQAGDYNSGATKGAELRGGGVERAVFGKYARLREAVARMGLERAWDMTPLLRVSEVATRLGCLMRVYAYMGEVVVYCAV